MPDVPLPLAPVPTMDRATFDRLARAWKEGTLFMSSTTDILAHPAYRQIVAAGPSMVPFILDDLQRHQGLWFDALSRLTGGAVTIPRHLAGRLEPIRTLWLQWGGATGHLPSGTDVAPPAA